MVDERDVPDRSASNADALRRALIAVRELRARVAQAERAAHEPIAIVGMGCRFPGGASSPARYWELLRAAREVLKEVPADRWDIEQFYDPDPDVPGRMYARSGGFIDEPVQEFDARFFGISPREAESLDPQQRLLLETTWEALEHAAIAPTSLAGTDTGVFVGIGTVDHLSLNAINGLSRVIDPYSGTGAGYSVASGRLSFFLGLHGPNAAVDTACSSSLVTVLLAVQALRTRSCSLALAGGVNVMLSPQSTTYMCNLRALSARGHCASFDSSADGYVRGEGAGMLVLKRLADAERDGDVVHAIIRGGAYNHDGRSAGLTVPNGAAQRTVIVAALADAGLNPVDVQYVEAHGTGTPLGDPIELNALGAAYGPGRVDRLKVGSVKTNMGHLEAAAGVAGIMKCVLSLEHEMIPQQLHVRQPTPHVDWNVLPIELVTQPVAWSGDAPRVAGVSAFGISGTNAHVLIEAATRVADTRSPDDMLPMQVLPLSAMDATALSAMAGNLADKLSGSPPLVADVAATLATGRTHFRERVALVVEDTNDAIRQLRLVASRAVDGIASAGRVTGEAPRVAFLFTGQGAQYAGMGLTLDATYPVFRAAIDRCAAILDGRLDVPLRTLLFSENDARLQQTVYTQPALFAFEFALSELLVSWGLRPRMVMGHSLGEYVAAVVSGVLPLEEVLPLVCERGRLMQSLPVGGAMAAVALDETSVREMLASFETLDLAAVNAPTSCVVSGAEADVMALIEAAKSRGVHATRLAVSHAFHSRLMEPILSDFRRVASGLSVRESNVTLISNRTGDVIGARELGDAAYWTDHLRGTVRFADGVATLGRLGADLVIEIGPTPALLGQAQESLPGTATRWLPTLRRGRDELRAISECLAGLYTHGVEIAWRAVHGSQPSRRVALPTYPWQRERHWRAGQVVDARERRAPTAFKHVLLGGRTSSALPTFEGEVGVASPAFLDDHRIAGVPLFPAAGFLELALAAGREVHPDRFVSLRDVSFQEALRLPDDGAATMQVILVRNAAGSDEFRIFSQASAGASTASQTWRLHATGELIAETVTATSGALDLASIRARCATPLDVDEYYATLRRFGGEFGPAFRSIVALARGANEVLGEVQLNDTAARSATSYRMHPALLDACFQLSPAAVGFEDSDSDDAASYVPVRVRGLRVHQFGVSHVFCHLTVPADIVRGQPTLTHQLTIVDADGRLVAEVDELTTQRVSRASMRALLGQAQRNDGLYQLEWTEQAAGAVDSPDPGRWILVGDDGETHAALAAELRARGHDTEYLVASSSFDAQEVERVIGRPSSLPFRGAVVVWPYAAPDNDVTLDALSECQHTILATIVTVARALEKHVAPMWVVTRGSQAFEGAVPDVLQAPMWGLAGSIALENPALRCARIDLDPIPAPGSAVALVDELCTRTDESAVAFRNHRRYVARLAPAVLVQDAGRNALRLEIRERGQLQNLALATVVRTLPGQDEVEIEVRAAGLNFRDVLNALGAYPGDPGALGNECAGVVTAIGSNVTALRVGDEVIALPQGGLATHVIAPAVLTVRKPASMTFAEAATIPVTFLTAQYALSRLGRMQSGDRVLVHAATGGVGMAAMQLARRAGATIIATAGSPAKRAQAAAHGASFVADSRATDFDVAVRDAIGDAGVDIVLNSLAGDFIPNSLGLIRPGGRFIELGKTGTWDSTLVEQRYPGVEYHLFFLGELAALQPDVVREMLLEIVADFACGALEPLPMHVFPLSRAEDAFRFMAQAKHTGKIVLTPPSRSTIAADANYLITGGLGGLGLAVAESLVHGGARHLTLMGRSAPNDDARLALDAMRATGVTVTVVAADVASESEVAHTLALIAASGHPLRGVIHAAGVIDDAVLADLDWARFRRVFAPKVSGAWNLQQQTRELSLDFFVLFSSMASVLGAAGQGNYAAANQFLDMLAHARRAQGLPALSINWGSWSEIGMAAGVSDAHRRRWDAAGFLSIAPDAGIRTMHELMARAEAPRIAVMPLDLDALGDDVPSLLRGLTARRAAKSSHSQVRSDELLQSLRIAPAVERPALLAHMLAEQLMRVLAPGSDYRPDPDRTLLELGMDSLMAIELRNRIAAHLAVTVTVGDLMGGQTIARLAETVWRMLPSLDEVAADETKIGVAVTDSGLAESWETGSL
ncbi:MAG: type I polyketide synthase [Gemmatimonadaceae bacterium]|nr:type I polyketide synthase [Gemmatimonadaceae bacterium]